MRKLRERSSWEHINRGGGGGGADLNVLKRNSGKPIPIGEVLEYKYVFRDFRITNNSLTTRNT